MKKATVCLLSLFLLLSLLTTGISASPGALHWYCIRNKAHRQPPLPTEFSFIAECNAYFLDAAHGDGNADRVVYLTFDAGYENGNVERVLDALADARVPAAFFVLKHFVERNGDLVERMLREGHLVCNHTAHHPDLSAASAERIRTELEGLEASYRELTGQEMPRYFRPPEGSFSQQMLKTVSNLGYKTVFWSFAYADWDNDKQPAPQKAMQCIMDNIHNGAVLLLHPTSKTNADILPRVIAELREQGYRFGTLEELCGGS